MLSTFLNVVGTTVVLIILLSMAIKIIPEYERAVLFRLGRLVGVRGPGLILIIPFIDQINRMSLRTIVFDVPVQEVITRDNVSCKVNAVLYYRVVEPEKTVINVEQFHEATSQLAQTTLRSVTGTVDLDTILSQRDKLNETIQQIVDESTDPWGIKVTAVEIKDVTLPQEMHRAIARQAEAERIRRAAVIQAEGERQAAEELANAANILAESPGALTVRALRSLSELSNTQNTTILFPLPMELSQLLPKSTAKEKRKRQKPQGDEA